MNTTFYIMFSIKTAAGLEHYGRFYIGNDRQAAYELFAKLKGNDDISDRDILYLELTETVDGLPVNIKLKSCTLAELGENCTIITKAVFNFLLAIKALYNV